MLMGGVVERPTVCCHCESRFISFHTIVKSRPVNVLQILDEYENARSVSILISPNFQCFRY